MSDEQVPDGNQNQAPNTEDLGWRAGVAKEYRDHEFIKDTKTSTDFIKKVLPILDEKKSLETRLQNAIFKPDDKATPEQIAEFHKALGVPEKASDYEFPKGEGVEHDPKMIEWAKGIFLKANLNKEQGATISQAWDALVQNMAKAENESAEAELKAADAKVKEEWKSDYEVNLELSKRAFKHFTDADLGEFKAHPTLIKAFYKIGKAMGEDFSPKGAQDKVAPTKEGFTYDKSPSLNKK